MAPNGQPGASQVSSQKLFSSLETATLLMCRKKNKVGLAVVDAQLPLAYKPLSFLWRVRHGGGHAHREFMESRICKDHRDLFPHTFH